MKFDPLPKLNLFNITQTDSHICFVKQVPGVQVQFIFQRVNFIVSFPELFNFFERRFPCLFTSYEKYWIKFF